MRREAADLIAHPLVLQLADDILLPYCSSYRLGSASAIEIWPGEKAQRLHRDDTIYPMRINGVEWQISALWALTDFTEQNGATRLVPGSHQMTEADLEMADAHITAHRARVPERRHIGTRLVDRFIRPVNEAPRLTLAHHAATSQLGQHLARHSVRNEGPRRRQST